MDFLNRLICNQPDICIFVFEQLFKGGQRLIVADDPEEVRSVPAHKRFGVGKQGKQSRESAGDIACIQFL